MAGEHFDILKGGKLVVDTVNAGTRQDGSQWMQIHVKDESGKIETGIFIDPPIPGLNNGDTIEVDDVSFRAKRSPNRFAYDKPKGPANTWQRIENPPKFITETAPQIKAHKANMSNFTGGGIDVPGFETLDDMDGELPF